jgi:hypothetical protein
VMDVMGKEMTNGFDPARCMGAGGAEDSGGEVVAEVLWEACGWC